MGNITNAFKIGTVAFVTGVLAGVTTGLLSAPHSGIRTRRKISRITGRVSDHAFKKVDQAKQTLDTVLKDGKQLVNWK